MGPLDRLHEDIGTSERFELIRDFRIGDIVSAPGHRELRNPPAVLEIARLVAAGELERVLAEPILLGIFTRVDSGEVVLRAIECLDGHHRLLGGLLAGAWRTVGDLPSASVDIRVNGWPAGGPGSEGRWIPLEVAEASTIPPGEWFEVPEEWGARGRTAQISGEISSIDPVFRDADRGVPLAELLDAWG
jgi:hypothetical protein